MADTIKISKNIKMVAHRGLSGLECENTLAAFIAAGNRDYYGIETDVHVTADGQLVVIHDDSTDRVSLSRLPVEGSTFEELRAIKLLDKDGQPRIDLHIPTLAEYLKICRRYDKFAVLELKNRFEKADIEKVVETVKTEYAIDKMIFISFCYENLVLLRELLPEATLQFLTVDAIDDKLADKLLAYNMDLDIHHKQITKEGVALLHSKGIKVNCWTCDMAETAETLIDCGVDFITSNILQ